MNFNNLVHEFITYCKLQKRLSDKTTKAYKIDLKQYGHYLHRYNLIVDSITRHDIRMYLHEISEQYKIKSIKRKLATLKAFYGYLNTEHDLELYPFLRLNLTLKEPFKLPTVLTLEETFRLLKSAYDSIKYFSDNFYLRSECIRDVAILELMFASGLRVSEVCNLNLNSIDMSSRTVVIHGKGSKERIIYLANNEVLDTLRIYLHTYKPEKYGEAFFINRLKNRISEQSIRNMIKKYARKANIQKHVTPHVLRHTFATLLLEEGVDVTYIQKFLGHSSIQTTQIYTHVSNEQQKKILTTFHPRRHLDSSFDVEKEIG